MIGRKVATAALVLACGVLGSAPAFAQDGECIVVTNDPLGGFVRTPIGNGPSGSGSAPLLVDGQAVGSVVTLTRLSTSRLRFSFDLGGGDGFTVEAGLTPASPVPLYDKIGDADSFVGVGRFAGATGDFTFGPQPGNSWGSDFTDQSPAWDGPLVAEWTIYGEICMPPPRVAICAEGRPDVLTLRYTGEDCSASSHLQAEGKVVCEGDPAFAPLVRIRVTDRRELFDPKANVWFDGLVPLGGLFDADAAAAGKDRLGANTMVHVLDLNGNLLQYVMFHTSCSQPLFTGDQFGSIFLYWYEVQPKPDEKGRKSQSVPGDLCADGKPQVVTMKYTGEDCTATSHSQSSKKVACDGDPDFAPTVRILATDKSDLGAKKARVWFDGTVALGGTFDIDATNDGRTRLKSNTYVYVLDGAGNVLQTVKFHTSCSQPLVAGDQFGSLELVDVTTE